MEGILRLQQSTMALPSGAAALDYAAFIGHREWFACWLIGPTYRYNPFFHPLHSGMVAFPHHTSSLLE